MTKAEQKKQLVDEVNRDEKRRIEGEAKRKEWEAKRAQGNNQKVAGAQGGGKGGNADGGKGGGRGGNADGGKGGGNQPAAGGKGAPPAGGNQVAVVAGAPQQGGRPPSTPESRNKRTSDRLDNSTPEYRAAKMEYQKLRDKTRAEMGIVTTPGGGGRPGGAPGGGTPGGKRGQAFLFKLSINYLSHPLSDFWMAFYFIS